MADGTGMRILQVSIRLFDIPGINYRWFFQISYRGLRLEPVIGLKSRPAPGRCSFDSIGEHSILRPRFHV
jgi:hypothetical protein